jgi:3-hydroxyacyl-CoA dehydrogenase/enoyl-CoA hydratase/3-hydroxybutyryl-CoA epimerase
MRGHYPAPLKAIEVAGRGFDAEARGFGEICVTSQCKNLIRVFFLREKYSKLRLPGGERAKKIEKVGVLGAGTMGAGIAMWCSARGLTVRLKDLKPEFVAAGMKRIEDAYRDGVKRRKITELQMQHGMARVHPTTEYTGFGDCDLVIEAVLEKIEVKRPVFAELTPLLRPDCVIASNTSAIPIDDLAAATGRPERFVGIHFFNPVHKMPLVEVVRGTKTDPAIVAAAVEFAKQLKKIPVVVKGAPGFLVNRLLMPYLNEAGVMLGEGVGVEAMDGAMVDFGWPMGPARLIDEIGVDVTLDVARELAEAFRDRMIVAPILRQVHEQGLKGRKGGAGFYIGERTNPAVKLPGGKTMSAEEIQKRLMNAMVAEAKLCMKEEIVAAEDDIDVAVIFGLGFPPFRGGLVKWARDAGAWS